MYLCISAFHLSFQYITLAAMGGYFAGIYVMSCALHCLLGACVIVPRSHCGGPLRVLAGFGKMNFLQRCPLWWQPGSLRCSAPLQLSMRGNEQGMLVAQHHWNKEVNACGLQMPTSKMKTVVHIFYNFFFTTKPDIGGDNSPKQWVCHCQYVTVLMFGKRKNTSVDLFFKGTHIKK